MLIRFCVFIFTILLISYDSIGQESDKKELDSIYALQATYYKSKQFQNIINLSHYAKNLRLNNAQDSITMARITAYIGYANNRFNKFYNSIEGFQDALKYIPKEESKGIIITKYNTLYDLMTRYYSLRRYKKALSTAMQIEELIDNYEFVNVDKQIWLHQRKFRIYSSLGFYDKAAVEIEKIKQKIKINNSKTENELVPSWVRYYRSSLLLDYYKSLNIKEESENYNKEIVPLEKSLLSNMAKLDSIVINTAFLQNPKSRQEVTTLSLYVGALYYMGDYYKQVENYTEALKYIEKALSLSKKSKEPIRNVSEFKRFKANVINELGDKSLALSLLAELESEYDASDFNYNEFLTFKGDIYTSSNEVDSVIYYYEKAVKTIHASEETLKPDFSNFASRYQFPNDSKQLQHMSDMLYDHFPSNPRATKLAKQLNQQAYQEFLINHNNLDLSQGNKALYHKIIQRLLENPDFITDKNKFVSNLENISNRLAWQQFSQSRSIVQLPIIDSLEKVEYEIRKALVQAKKQKNYKKKDSLQNTLSKFQKEVNNTFPKISDFTQDNFDITEFQENLEDRDIVLKYLFFKKQFAILAITKSEISWELKPWTTTEQNTFKSYLEFLKNPKQSNLGIDSLTNILIPKKALDFDNILIIPDLPIYYFPFETLIYKNKYLIESKSIRYSSHLRFAFLKQESKKRKASLTIFAPDYKNESSKTGTRSSSSDLIGAKNEANKLKNLFPSQGYIGQSATKENFIQHKSEGNILHLAMHAAVDENTPMFSHFEFSNDEKLFLEELYALKIPADLAVLSACNTAVGKEDGTLSVSSLHRAFNYAGTAATIASLWEVPDETTSKIMVSFYEYLKEGITKSEALQMAKKDYLESTDYAQQKHPYYWAGFVLYGSDEAVSFNSYMIWYVFIAFAILVIVLLLIRNRKHFNS